MFLISCPASLTHFVDDGSQANCKKVKSSISIPPN